MPASLTHRFNAPTPKHTPLHPGGSGGDATGSLRFRSPTLPSESGSRSGGGMGRQHEKRMQEVEARRRKQELEAGAYTRPFSNSDTQTHPTHPVILPNIP